MTKVEVSTVLTMAARTVWTQIVLFWTLKS